MDSNKQVSPSKRKTILFICLNSVSHMNSVLSMANHLKDQGHRTAFLFNRPFCSKLDKLGHEVYDCTTPDLSASPCDDSIGNDASNLMVGWCRQFWMRGNHIETTEFVTTNAFPHIFGEIREFDDNVANKMKLLQPDLLVFDHFFMSPALFKLNLPWARVWSASPLGLHNQEDLPEPFLGLPTNWDKNDPKQVDWNERSRRVRRKLYDEVINPYWTSHGFPDLPTDPVDFLPVSPYLNIYMFPEEIDYEQPLEKWQRCDCLIREHKINKLEIPEKIRDLPGKLIFLSLGSLASADAELMRRLTSMLADCPHKFIVVKGPNGHEFELPANMWGDKFLPQLDILPIIDLIITHGGNNTLTESLFHGVPGFIVCPLFGDQPDIARRVEEKGLGLTLDPYNCTKEQLHGAIEKLLGRSDLKEKVKAISRRMQQSESCNKPFKLIDDFVSRY